MSTFRLCLICLVGWLLVLVLSFNLLLLILVEVVIIIGVVLVVVAIVVAVVIVVVVVVVVIVVIIVMIIIVEIVFTCCKIYLLVNLNSDCSKLMKKRLLRYLWKFLEHLLSQGTPYVVCMINDHEMMQIVMIGFVRLSRRVSKVLKDIYANNKTTIS